jgi:hypothetical protein
MILKGLRLKKEDKRKKDDWFSPVRVTPVRLSSKYILAESYCANRSLKKEWGPGKLHKTITPRMPKTG